MSSPFINIAAYKFVEIDNLPERKKTYLEYCQSLGLKGTILLSREGINLFLSGTRSSIDSFVDFLRGISEFADIPIKESPSDHQPHSRMLVRLKKEIISMGVEQIRPQQKTSPKITPHELKSWLDSGREITLLDVRNDYEVDLGTFKNAVPIGVDTFREFPDAVDTLSESIKEKPVVMFCTGGIRCEKAGPLMEQKGFDEVYQLDGGILKYFEDCGGDYYDGDCFVFDKRVAVNPELEETDSEQCYACQAILTAEDQESDRYDPPNCCPHCYLSPVAQMERAIQKRNDAIAGLITPLPGSTPYNNVRPINVPLRFDRSTMIDVLIGMHPQIDPQYWRDECVEGRIVWKDSPLQETSEVRSGWRVEHLLPQTVEPDVNGQFEIVFEDDVLVAVNKSAPLPMHPCGRFNRNSLQYLINGLYSGEQIRICHRLDANTSGLVICARKKSAARSIQPQFESGTVVKSYLAEVMGNPPHDEFTCEASISAEPTVAGGRVVDENGLSAKTEFQVVERRGETTLLKCTPKTGRTNQIRIHLWSLALPIQGDPLYLPDHKLGKAQTLTPQAPPMKLHASSLELTHPKSHERIKLVTPNPDWAN